MNSLRQLCAAFVLTLALAFSAFAGNISTMIVPPPPSPSPTTTTQGDISTMSASGGQMQIGITASATEIALMLAGQMLSLL